MSRIRGIEARIPKDTLQVQKARHEALKRVGEDHSKSKDDAEKKQISELLQKLPKLDKIFEVHKKIGEGTFSSVYLGSLRQHAGLPDAEKKWFAIKHLVPTAHPARIEHELRCLQDMGGRNHVIGVELCLRHLDTIVFVMPYIPHRKFSEYIVDMDALELQRYMRALLTALAHVHSFGVIHRDVKPSNFLYDRQNQRYLLVDFGLAQRICGPEDDPPALPAAPPPPAHSNTLQKRPREQDDCGPDAKRMALDLSVRTKMKPDDQVEKQPDIQPNTQADTHPETQPNPQPIPQPNSQPKVQLNTRSVALRTGSQPRLPVQVAVKEAGGVVGAGALTTCGCVGRGGVCGACARRPPARAPRAGTQGFRPPEVLLKVVSQGTGVDTWAAGVVLASALSRRYPLLRAADDAAALAELAALLGTPALRAAARAMGRRIVTSTVRRGICLRKLCTRVRGGAGPPSESAPPGPPCAACRQAPDRCLCLDEGVNAEDIRPGVSVCGFPDSAFALAARLLQPLPSRRPSAAAALQHPFFTEPLPPTPPQTG